MIADRRHHLSVIGVTFDVGGILSYLFDTRYSKLLDTKEAKITEHGYNIKSSFVSHPS